MQRDVSCVASHDFDDENTVVRIHGIPDLINGFHRGVHRCIKPDSKIGAINIFVNGARDTDAWDAELLVEFYGAAKWTVSADNDHRVNFSFL